MIDGLITKDDLKKQTEYYDSEIAKAQGKYMRIGSSVAAAKRRITIPSKCQFGAVLTLRHSGQIQWVSSLILMQSLLPT